MKKLYKFLSYRSDFFKSPKIRISQRTALNDPFECLPAANQVADLYDRIFNGFKQQGSDVRGYDKIGDAIRQSDESHYKYTALFNGYGIVSLSQSYNNILMWSHYSNQHSGIVIELDTSTIGLDNQICHSGFIAQKSSLARPIYYSNDRQVQDNEKYSFDHLFDSYFIKSEYWSYEKEYRIVASLCDATEVEITTHNFKKIEELGYEMFFDRNPIDQNRLKIHLNKNAYITQKNHTFGDNPDKMRNNILSNAYSSLAEDPSSLFLYEIPKNAIKSIFLGCCIESKNKECIINDLKHHGYSCSIYQMKRHPDKFELMTEKI